MKIPGYLFFAIVSVFSLCGCNQTEKKSYLKPSAMFTTEHAGKATYSLVYYIPHPCSFCYAALVHLKKEFGTVPLTCVLGTNDKDELDHCLQKEDISVSIVIDSLKQFKNSNARLLVEKSAFLIDNNGLILKSLRIEEQRDLNSLKDILNGLSRGILFDHTTDSRDGKSYKTVIVGNQTWMAENLAYLPKVSPPSKGADRSGLEPEHHYYVYGYEGSSVEEAKESTEYQELGVLYNYWAALDACPSGWHLPTDEEWQRLEKELGMPKDELSAMGHRKTGKLGLKLKSNNKYWDKNSLGVDSFGFDVRGAGSVGPSKNDGRFHGINEMTTFWTATPTEQDARAFNRWLNTDKNKISLNEVEITGNEGITRFHLMKCMGVSVRCVKD